MARGSQAAERSKQVFPCGTALERRRGRSTPAERSWPGWLCMAGQQQGGGKQPQLGRREGYHGKNKTEHVAYWSAPSLPYDCTNCSSCVSERGAASPYCDGFVLIQVLYLLLSLHFILDGMYGFVQEAALQCCSAFSSSLLCQAQYSVVSFISMEKSRANPNLSSRPLS